MRAGLTALFLCLAGMATAQEIDRSPRPMPNPTRAAVAVPEAAPEVSLATAEAAAPPPEGALVSSLRPKARPKALAEKIAALKATSNAPGLGLAVEEDSAETELAAVAPPTKKEKRKKKRDAASMAGSVCGVPAIKGEEIAPIGSKVGGCGVPEAVKVTSVSGVRLSQAATVDCSLAKQLNSWVDEVAQPAFDGKLVELRVAAHYICRSRNNIKGARISEHGKGKAIDISGFVLSNGRLLTVQDNYNKLLRGIYKAGCKYFKTTLGPGSDGYHEDHMHFDTAVRKNGSSYCR